MATFYLVSTPIGNLEDVTVRAIKTLSSVDIILCEDTREMQKILDYCQTIENAVKKPLLLSTTDYNWEQRTAESVNYLLKGKNIALVSDRGTPLISDPGYKLVREIIKLTQINPEIQITCLPGGNAVLPAVQLSGFPPDKFMFIGFLPKKDKARSDLLKSLPETTIVAYESPERLVDTLNSLQSIFGNIQIAVCRELTKFHEQVIRGQITEVIKKLTEQTIKGEVTLVVSLK
jgi:16S rRNA (cytidine1402-2'-O)-methyltransferase